MIKENIFRSYGSLYGVGVFPGIMMNLSSILVVFFRNSEDSSASS